MPKRRLPLLYQKRGRFFANLKRFAPWGGRCEAMIPDGERFATTDRSVAESLLLARLAELEKAKRSNPFPMPEVALTRAERSVALTFAAFAERCFDSYSESGRGTERHAKDLRHRARAFGAFIGPMVQLENVTEANVADFITSLRKRGLTEASQRHYLNAIGAVYRRAKAENLLTDRRFNPARDLDDKPRPSSGGEAFLEIFEGALLIDTARLLAERAHPSQRQDAEHAHAAIAAGLLTGGRRSEVMGLLITDLEFREAEESVHFTPRRDRRLKNRGSQRRVPMWPQLRDILRLYLNHREARILQEKARPSVFLFPARLGEGFVRDIGRCFANAVTAAGLEHRFQADWWRVLRRSYASARLQTIDGDQPVAEFTVERELGHGSGAMLRRVYGKVGRIRHRSPVVEYHLETFTSESGPLSKSRRVELLEMIAARDKRVDLLPSFAASEEAPIATR